MDLLFDTPKTDQRKEKICCWANCYIDIAQTYYIENFTREKKLLELKESIYKQGHLTKSELEILAKWKSPRNANRIIKNNSEKLVKEKTSASFKATDPYESINPLRELKRIDWAIASAILHFFHKDKYPIYDIHALRAVGKEKGEGVWGRYVEFCRKVAKDNKVDMRTLDRALYRFGYVQSVLNYYEDDLACLGVKVSDIINGSL
ncbi:hypothetical protein F4083_05355 [Candidatus Poribacteria bacterium]|nr:hypothetical protein [Candidatus Poribacteria bacterium]MYF55398.1 hypothetical protein [Candidatus Poribacteria bacterium]MYI93735.1 hypothetical protein [Candidatus Poribacteria bacterium]